MWSDLKTTADHRKYFEMTWAVEKFLDVEGDKALKRVENSLYHSQSLPWFDFAALKSFIFSKRAALALSFSFAIVLLLVVALPLMKWEPPRGYYIKGISVLDADAFVSIKVYRAKQYVEEGYKPQGVKNEISPADGLLFSYSNTTYPAYRYLMICGVASDFRIFWYFPQYQSLAENPASIPIGDGFQAPLPEQIWHQYQRGELTLFAIFSMEPFQVKYVEALIDNMKKSGMKVSDIDRIPINNTGQHRIQLMVK